MIDLSDVLNVLQLEAWPKSVARDSSLQEARKQWEREYVLAALKQHHGHMRLTAKALGIERTNLYRKMRELQIPVHRFDANGIGESAHPRSDSEDTRKRPRGRPRRQDKPSEPTAPAHEARQPDARVDAPHGERPAMEAGAGR